MMYDGGVEVDQTTMMRCVHRLRLSLRNGCLGMQVIGDVLAREQYVYKMSR